MVSILVVSCSIVAAFIGAGFASGQEILCYFVVFERYGIWGLITSALFFAVFIFTVLLFTQKNGISSYADFLEIFRSRRTRHTINALTALFSFAVYSAMLSALTELISAALPVPAALAGAISAVMAVAILTRGSDKAFTLNGYIGIVLVFLMSFAILYVLVWRETHVFSPVIIHSVQGGFIYGGYNLVTLTPILVSLSKKLRTKADTVSVTLITTLVTVILMGLVYGLLSVYYGKINLGELPLLTLAKRQSIGFGIFYTFILSGAIITTLLSSGGAVIDSLRIRNKPLRITEVSVLAYSLSGIGFTNLINSAYRVCGIAGAILCVCTVFAIIRASKAS